MKEGVGALDDAVLMMNDDLSRMVLNPDVTVRQVVLLKNVPSAFSVCRKEN